MRQGGYLLLLSGLVALGHGFELEAVPQEKFHSLDVKIIPESEAIPLGSAVQFTLVLANRNDTVVRILDPRAGGLALGISHHSLGKWSATQLDLDGAERIARISKSLGADLAVEIGPGESVQYAG